MTILQRLKERRKELTQEQKEIKTWDLSKEEKGIQKIIGRHRIDELDYIIVLLKKEGIIKETRKDKLLKLQYEKEKIKNK